MTTYPVSPNTVLANALTSAEDLLRPHIVNAEPERIVFVVGTQINGAPHIGTSLVQSLTFAAAARIRDRFGVPAVVQFSALDNAPYAIVTDKESGHHYQRAYAHALGAAGIAEQIDKLYRPLFTALSERLKVPFSVETYTQQQAAPHFRRTWLRVLPRMDAARWYLSPSSGVPHVRVPCPRPGCGGGPRSTPSAPAYVTTASSGQPSRPCACTTVSTRWSSNRRTAATWTWPRSTAIWSRN